MANLRLVLIAAAATLNAMAAMPAAAQSAEAMRAMPVIGNAPRICTLQRGRIATGALVNIDGLDGDTLRIQQLADPSTLAARAASATIAFEAVCNFPHRLRIESQNNGLWPTDSRVSGVPAGFAYAVPYEAQVHWSDRNGTLDADAKIRRNNEQRVSVDEATAGTVTLEIRIAQGASNVAANAPVLAGIYSDTLRIFLEPR